MTPPLRQLGGRGAAARPLSIVILGLTVTSSWGNGHATTYRALMRGLARRGHSVLFLESDQPWYRENRDLPELPYGRVALYRGLASLRARWLRAIRDADLVMLGSYVPEGIEVGRLVQQVAQGVTAFYDIDTPVTLAQLQRRTCPYLSADLIPGFDLYLSFTGGPTLEHLERKYGAKAARALYCAVDPEIHGPAEEVEPRWDLGYLGTYSADRQPMLDRLLGIPAKRWRDGRFVVAGSLYPPEIAWPGNVARIEHVPPGEHRRFYASQRFTLNVTRADMVRLGWSPSVRLFEAAACGVPVISDRWSGLEELFVPGKEILIARDEDEILAMLRGGIADSERLAIGRAARARVLAAHTADSRAAELEATVAAARAARGWNLVTEAKLAVGTRAAGRQR
jgi:spore maturation protein CgeB